jgi:hypothetical protein
MPAHYLYIGKDPYLIGMAAIGMIATDGNFVVQVDKVNHPWGHGWHATSKEDWRLSVRSLEQLQELAVARKSVSFVNRLGWTGHQGYVPAVWALNFTGSILLRMFNNSMYVYQPKSKRGVRNAKGSQANDEAQAS